MADDHETLNEQISALSDNVAQLEQEKDEIRRTADDLEATLQHFRDKVSQLEQEKDVIRSTADATIKDLQSQLKQLNRQKDVINRTATATEKELQDRVSQLQQEESAIRGMKDFQSKTGVNLLLIAAAKGRHNAVEGLLDAGVDINSMQHGLSALSLAAYYDRKVVVDLLLGRWANVNLRGSARLTDDLNLDIETLATLLHASATSVGEHIGELDTTALHAAAAKDRVDIAEALLENYAENAKDNKGRTAFALADEKGHKRIVDLLLERDYRLWAPEGYDANDLAEEKHLAAASNNHVQPRTDLMELITSFNAHADVGALLISAAKAKDAKAVRLLLDHGANLKAEDAAKQNTALILASRAGDEQTCRILLDRGAGVQKEVDGAINTALILASKGDHRQTCRMLLDRSADLEARDKQQGHTTLISAVKEGHKELTRLLLGRGAKINAQTNDKHTALMHAADNGNIEIVKVLLEQGAATSLRNRDGHTAYDLATRANKMDVADVLQKWKGWTPEISYDQACVVVQRKLFERRDKKMSKQKYRGILMDLGLIRSDQEVGHIIAEKNGGADHPDNYFVISGGFNGQTGEKCDDLNCCIVGEVRALEAVAVSIQQKQYIATDKTNGRALFKAGLNNLKTNIKKCHINNPAAPAPPGAARALFQDPPTPGPVAAIPRRSKSAPDPIHTRT